MKKRICLIARRPSPQDNFMVQYAETLTKAGYHMDTICLQVKGQPKFEEHGDTRIFRVVKENPDKVKFYQYILQSFVFMTAAFFKLQFLSARKQYDLIIVFGLPEYLVFIAFLQKILGVPIILVLWDLSIDLYDSRWSSNNNRIAKTILKYIEKLSCKMANGVITASHGFKEKLIERGIPESKLSVIMNTADTNIFQFDGKRSFSRISEKAKLIYHGTVSRRFGLLKAVDALAKLQEKIPESVLYIYGTYDQAYRKDLERRIDELNINKFVYLNGRHNLYEIYDIIKTCDIGVVPYLDDNFMNLALSTKTFEYVAAGLPVVASRLRSTMRIFDDQCITYFDVNNENDLPDKLYQLCLSPDLRRKRAEAAHKVYKKLPGKVMGERLVKVVGNFCRDDSYGTPAKLGMSPKGS